MDGRRSNSTRVSVGSRGSNDLVSISKMSNTSVSNMASIGTVTNGTKSANNTVRIVNTSYNTAIGESRCNLANSVGITVSFDSGEGQKDLGERKLQFPNLNQGDETYKCKSSHLDLAEQSS